MSIYSFKNFKNKSVAEAYDKGIAYQKAGDFEDAINQFKIAIEMDPVFVEAYNSLALTYKKAGNFSNALKLYNLGIEIHFQNIYDKIKKYPIKFSNNKYSSSNSETWSKVAIDIAIKNSAKDGIKQVRFPKGKTAVKMAEENSVIGCAFKDDGDIRYFLPTYFSVIYEELSSDILYSILINNVGTLSAESGSMDRAEKCFLEAIEFTPIGVEFTDPILGLKEIKGKNE